jgi:hypothetical protein
MAHPLPARPEHVRDSPKLLDERPNTRRNLDEVSARVTDFPAAELGIREELKALKHADLPFLGASVCSGYTQDACRYSESALCL